MSRFETRADETKELPLQYDVTVLASVYGSLATALEDLESWLGADATLHVKAQDQAALVAIVNRLHDLGVTIAGVQPAGPPARATG